MDEQTKQLLCRRLAEVAEYMSEDPRADSGDYVEERDHTFMYNTLVSVYEELKTS